MDAKERSWALAKAGILEIQSAFWRIMLSRRTTYEGLRDEVKKYIEDTDKMVRDIRADAGERAPNRNGEHDPNRN